MLIFGHEDRCWHGGRWTVVSEEKVIETGACYWASCIFEPRVGDSVAPAEVEVELKEVSLRLLVVD